MNHSNAQLLDLQEHCARLSDVLKALWQQDISTLVKDEEAYRYGAAADWLELAAGVCKVDVLTGRFDNSLMYCSSAREYENARSDLLTRLATELTVFSFAWCALETVSKLVDPPSIPADQRSTGANGLIDRVIFFIKPLSSLPKYRIVLSAVERVLTSHPRFAALLQKDPLSSHMGESGVGLDFVRRVRNDFAHGSASLPMPDVCSHGWCGRRSTEPDLIRLSTRIVLFTIQMLLCAFYRGKNFDIDSVLEDAEGFSCDADIHLVLTTLHLSPREVEDADKEGREEMP